MTALGIVLLVIGIMAIIAGFFIPDNEKKEDKNEIEKKREQIRKLMETELDGMKLRVNEATNETVEYGMEKSERSLEKITNDKIMAISEYASTIMEEIDKSHKEVLFLYDMLNDKQVDIKNTVRHAEAAVREVNDATKTASDTAVYAATVANAATEAVVNTMDLGTQTASQMQISAQELPSDQPVSSFFAGQDVFVNTIDNEQREPLIVDKTVAAPKESVFNMAAAMDFNTFEPEVVPIVAKKEEEEPKRELTDFEKLEQSTSFKNTSNNNQMILKLHGQGVPVVDIARQLSLGVGEVQLVIDLFK